MYERIDVCASREVSGESACCIRVADHASGISFADKSIPRRTFEMAENDVILSLLPLASSLNILP